MTTTVPQVTATQPGVISEPTFEQLATRVDDAVKALESLDPAARTVAEELKAAVEAIHRAGLVTIVRSLRADDATRPVLFDLVDDPVVHLLLSLHQIVRPDPMTEATRALQEVRPQLQGHGGDVTLVRIDGGIAFVRLTGACNGCSMSSVTLRNLVEKALVDGVAAINGIEVVPNEPEQTVISPESLFSTVHADDGWAHAGAVTDMPVNGLVAPVVTTQPTGQEVSVLLVSRSGQLSCYVNECAHEALPLDNAVFDAENGTLTCPWHGFCYDAGSGECLTAPEAQLEQLPLRVSNGQIWIRVGP
ncbi:NifU family protein [Mycolicibacterium fluoranthenivorans]|jgi:Fe-S cluster biogenesis protein NfuA/nitrite reductase/ring-hydroxylating ferredoxin subunit|uniref:Ferredoxin subunit of nitrite reductase or a ring-hydroxylating dioxygenase n=1 Tax=Mycolicibacterium fluoranthenivorans TaxID=258505 RepID=A0A1G4WYW2_9MYCO|nr:NifU family protein [Mycolicibacterium fluoranthenivorans]QNJ93909.1 NifU family protein [Mycolicibacterium fluoranthenivorans]SCX32588.1 Ferredoxin subunit of nitrite reductase or a ring-hydroxylating dioxygenase [Mycolicibacterium fluoranthenivorans]